MVKKVNYSPPPDTSRAVEIQKELSPRVVTTDLIGNVSCIAGVDISVGRWNRQAVGSVVLLSYPELEIIEVRTSAGEIGFPYIPGLLSFRELPHILAAFELLSVSPDLIIVDGQGIAHPRRFGLASHLGVILDIPAIGCAKSRLCGSHMDPGNEPGDYSIITDKDEIIGAVLRTRRDVKPLYISTGHRISLETAVKWIMNCCRGYRLPQPTRLAHLAAGGNLKITGLTGSTGAS